jgi:hypothetical protein
MPGVAQLLLCCVTRGPFEEIYDALPKQDVVEVIVDRVPRGHRRKGKLQLVTHY